MKKYSITIQNTKEESKRVLEFTDLIELIENFKPLAQKTFIEKTGGYSKVGAVRCYEFQEDLRKCCIDFYRTQKTIKLEMIDFENTTTYFTLETIKRKK